MITITLSENDAAEYLKNNGRTFDNEAVSPSGSSRTILVMRDGLGKSAKIQAADVVLVIRDKHISALRNRYADKIIIEGDLK